MDKNILQLLGITDPDLLTVIINAKQRTGSDDIVSVIICLEFQGSDRFRTLLNLVQKDQRFPLYDHLIRKPES